MTRARTSARTRARTLHDRTRAVTIAAVAAAALLAVTACDAKTSADKVDTTGVTAVGSGTPAGESATAARGRTQGSLMGDSVVRDSILGDSAGHDTINRRPTKRP